MVIDLKVDTIQHCHICSASLQEHPLYVKDVGVTCPNHGDFFYYRQRGENTTIIFRPFETAIFQTPKTVQKKLPPSSSATRQVGRRDRPGLRIRCNQTGVIFSSLTKASIAMFLGRGNLSEHVSGKISHVKGYTFTLLGDDDLDAPFIVQPRVQYANAASSRAVRCEQNGLIFESARAAARAMKLNRNNMWMHMNDRSKRPRVSGYSFEYLDKEV